MAKRHSKSPANGKVFPVESDIYKGDKDGRGGGGEKVKFKKSVPTCGADRKKNGHGAVPWGVERITWKEDGRGLARRANEEETDEREIRSQSGDPSERERFEKNIQEK